MSTLPQDARNSLRGLVRNPGFSITAVLILALGIGSITPTFSVINAFLLRPLPFAQPERLVHVWASETRKGLLKLRVSLPDFEDWKRRNRVFSDLAAFNYTSEDLTGQDKPEQISAGRVSANIFDLLGVRPTLGRGFAKGEDQPGATPVVVLSHEFWETRFGSDPKVLQRTLEINRQPYAIVGVMPPEFVFPLPTTQIWIPHVLDAAARPRDRSYLQVVGRLKPGATIDQAQSEMTRVAGELETEYPQTNARRGAFVEPLRAALNFAHEIFQVMSVILLVANFFVLLIASANVASLLLGRGLKRSREVAIRSALGASRLRLIRQFMVESLTLGLAGGAVGLLLAFWLVDLASRSIPDDLYRVGELSVDGPALLFTFAVSLLATVMFGTIPALAGSRTDLNESLKEGAKSVAGGIRSLKLQNALVAAEIGVALALLIGSSLMIRSLVQLGQVDPGFNPDHVLTLKLILPADRYAENGLRSQFHSDVAGKVGSLPGVLAATTVDYLPLNHETSLLGYSIPGREKDPTGRVPTASWVSVAPGYFASLGIPFRQGRDFDATDRADGAPVAIVNRVLADRLFDSDPTGRLLELEGFSSPVRVVGVVEATKHTDLAESPMAQVYTPASQTPQRYFRVIAKTAGDPLAMASAVQSAVWSVDPDLPITEVRPLKDVVSEFLLPQRVVSVILGLLSMGAMLLAGVGIYGLLAFHVSQRLPEMGIRMAMGATGRDVVRMVLRRGLFLTLWGIGFGLAGGGALSVAMSSQLYGIGPADWLSFTLVPGLLILIAGLSCYLPARRAAKVDPMTILRCE